MKIGSYLENYEENQSKLKELNISKKFKILSFVLGYGLGLLIVMSPVIIISHLFIFSQYKILWTLLILLFVALFLAISDIFYHKFLGYFCPSVKEISLKINFILNSIIYLIICLIAFGILLISMRWL
jgi:hypothetical protein